jgi:hypothetical protein
MLGSTQQLRQNISGVREKNKKLIKRHLPKERCTKIVNIMI